MGDGDQARCAGPRQDRRHPARTFFTREVAPQAETGVRDVGTPRHIAAPRELDVFVKENIEPATRDALLHKGGKAIKKEFAARRDRAFARATEAVNSEHYRSLLIDALQWIEGGQRIASEDARTPIRKFAARLLQRHIKKLRKSGRDLDKMSSLERHKLRIRAKKIRYAVEFFERLFQSGREQKQLARLSKHLKKIQNALGSLNDFVAHRDMAVDAALKAPPRNGRARAFASGVMLGREEQAVKPLLKVAAKEVRGLAGF
jgi:CHAD domain-containing protein